MLFQHSCCCRCCRGCCGCFRRDIRRCFKWVHIVLSTRVHGLLSHHLGLHLIKHMYPQHFDQLLDGSGNHGSGNRVIHDLFSNLLFTAAHAIAGSSSQDCCSLFSVLCFLILLLLVLVLVFLPLPLPLLGHGSFTYGIAAAQPCSATMFGDTRIVWSLLSKRILSQSIKGQSRGVSVCATQKLQKRERCSNIIVVVLVVVSVYYHE